MNRIATFVLLLPLWSLWVACDAGSDCDAVACTAVACGEGQIQVQVEGDCCGTCQPNPCADERAAFEATLAGWLSAAAIACETDDDCTRLMASNSCKSSCTGAAVNTSSAQEIGSQVSAYADANCGHCPTDAQVCGAISMLPQCENLACR